MDEVYNARMALFDSLCALRDANPDDYQQALATHRSRLWQLDRALKQQKDKPLCDSYAQLSLPLHSPSSPVAEVVADPRQMLLPWVKRKRRA